MDKINDGGPAFPLAKPGDCMSASDGMSLRDYFAAKALPACIAECVITQFSELDVARLAYNFADAMLKAREHKS